MISRHRSLVGVATAAAAIALLLPAGSASSAEERDSASGSGNNGVGDFEFDAFNQGTTPQDPAGGRFEASNAFIDFKGPITCLHVDGNKAGFIYPLEEGSMPEAVVGQAVLITVVDNGPGNVDMMGFVGPAPIPEIGPCMPGPAPLAIDGDVLVHDAG